MGQLVTVAQVWMGALFLATTPNGQQTEPPFVAVWNAPTYACETKHGIDILISEHGIIENSDGRFKGDKMVIFWETLLGLYPWLDANETAYNGGIPQLADFEAHFAKAEKDIEFYIPDEDFSGYAVIDWENWRPIYDTNWSSKRMYQRWSRALVVADHPDWNDTMIEEEARNQFETAARLLMEGTLEKAKDLRPKAKWGFYGFPRCYNNKGESTCSELTQSQNNQLGWLFEASTTIYPSAYIRQSTINPRNFVYGQNTEALRVNKKFSKPEVPVITYTRYQKGDEIEDFYNQTDMEHSLQLSIDQGVSGVILWGSSASLSSKGKCQALSNYMRETFGPYTQKILKNAGSCSISLCNSNGRCYKKDPLYNTNFPDVTRDIDIEDILTSPEANKIHDIPYRIWRKQMILLRRMRALYQDDYLCRCYSGWEGDQCDLPTVN